MRDWTPRVWKTSVKWKRTVRSAMPEPVADLLVGAALRDEGEHLDLSRRQGHAAWPRRRLRTRSPPSTTRSRARQHGARVVPLADEPAGAGLDREAPRGLVGARGNHHTRDRGGSNRADPLDGLEAFRVGQGQIDQNQDPGEGRSAAASPSAAQDAVITTQPGRASASMAEKPCRNSGWSSINNSPHAHFPL